MKIKTPAQIFQDLIDDLIEHMSGIAEKIQVIDSMVPVCSNEIELHHLGEMREIYINSSTELATILKKAMTDAMNSTKNNNGNSITDE